MNKILTIAGIATLFLASCNNEETPNLIAPNEYATIELGISNDNEMISTRAEQTANLSEWKASVTPKQVGETAPGKTDATGWVAANALGSFAPGGYAIEVSNYATEAEIYSNGGKGDAYYKGSMDKALVKGSNSVAINCGKAKNCRVKADLSGITGVAGITDVVLKAKQTGDDVTRAEYTFANNDVAYFYASKNISYTLDYKYNGTAKTQVSGSITSPEAATEYKITIGTTDNGKIVLTITYDDAFTDGGNTSVTIDAATGEEATTQPQS